MHNPPEIIRTTSARVACSGASDTAGDQSAALGHPRVWMQIDPELGYVDCGYCDRRFVLADSVADVASKAASAP